MTGEIVFQAGKSGSGAANEALPEWRLEDLYPAMDSKAFSDDLSAVEPLCRDFADKYRGKIATIAVGKDGAATLFEALKAYELIEDKLGELFPTPG